MESYKYTGVNVPVSLDVLITYVISLLQKYDADLAQGIVPPTNPYNEKIIMQHDGITIDIPEEVHREAVKKWEILKMESMKKNIEDENIKLSNELNNEIKKRDLRYTKFGGDTIWSYLFKIFLMIIIVAIVIYVVKEIKRHI